MNRFERVVQILNEAVGGPAEPVGFHGAFWRGRTRDQFVAHQIFGLPLITPENGAESNLCKALKGESPFGADLPTPPANASFNRMPSGRAPVPAAQIAFIQTWIDDGCPEDRLEEPTLLWRKTNAPVASSRTDDIWFLDPSLGFAVNSNGHVLKTTDGGESWQETLLSSTAYLRCVAFANANLGWVGTLSRPDRLFVTPDGGATWRKVTNLPDGAPVAVCGLSVVNELVVYASGTNRPADVPALLKTTNGGQTWSVRSMADHASVLIDCHFFDEIHGFVVGGKATEPTPTTRNKLKPVVLETTDGGSTWVNRLAGQEAEFPFGEWGWKIQFLDAAIGFVSLENFSAGAILTTTDGGRTWRRRRVNDAQSNANLEGIGFIDAKHGWVGGWGNADFSGGFSSSTNDGGESWQDANDIGRFINRFRFLGNPVSVGYASGDTVYKYSDEAPNNALVAERVEARPLLPQGVLILSGFPAEIPLAIPEGTKRITLLAWDRFGVELGPLLDEERPAAGPRVFAWNGRDSRGDAVPKGDIIVRLLADDAIASSIVRFR